MQTNAPVEVTMNGGGSSASGGGGGGGRGLKRGTKRDASDSNLSSDFERFEKRLRMLSLRGSERNGTGNATAHLYTPVSNDSAEATSSALTHANGAPSQADDEYMHVDDTRDRVYIHNLDAELADIEDDNGKERLVFLPDIEKHFSKIPQQVLTGGDDSSRELVLYDIPRSLTVDESHDSARRAIIESRQRAREKAAEESRRADVNRRYDHTQFNPSMETAHGYGVGYAEEQHPDADAMDLG